MHSLLFNFLDELLFVFSTELFVPLELHITEFDRTKWQLEATGYAR
jgi:SHS2 domain-containing protein